VFLLVEVGKVHDLEKPDEEYSGFDEAAPDAVVVGQGRETASVPGVEAREVAGSERCLGGLGAIFSVKAGMGSVCFTFWLGVFLGF